MTLDEMIQFAKQALEKVNPDKRVCTEFRFTVGQVKQLLEWLEDYKRLQSVSSWIQCEEKMPEVGLSNWVLVSDVDGFVFMATRDLHNWESFNDGLPIDFETITHWMPLPEPPKEV